MGRQYKLTDKQQESLLKELLNGGGVSELARKYGVGKATVSRIFSERLKKIKRVGNQIVTVEQELKSLDIVEQKAVFSYADSLRSVMEAQVSGTQASSAVYLILANTAKIQAETLDPVNPDIETLHNIAVLTRTANEAAAPGFKLLEMSQKQSLSEKSVTSRVDKKTARRMAKALLETVGDD